MDGKGRIVVPKPLQDQLGPRFVVGRGQVGCVTLYSEKAWASLLEIVAAAHPLDPARATLERMLVGGARQGELDSAGRLLVPPEFRSFARLSEKVVLVGLVGTVEIWASDEYESFQRDPMGYEQPRQDALKSAFEQLRGPK